MKPSSPKTILVDTGFWIALLDPRDDRHADARSRTDQLDVFRMAVPWPSLYETLNTRLARKPPAMARFQTVLTKPTTVRIDDQKYREEAVELTFSNAISGVRPMSLVDWVVRLMLADRNVKIHALWTYNPGDFHDVCRSRGIAMP
jgi:predicted nucleic acid-binding protein